MSWELPAHKALDPMAADVKKKQMYAPFLLEFPATVGYLALLEKRAIKEYRDLQEKLGLQAPKEIGDLLVKEDPRETMAEKISSTFNLRWPF